MEPGCFPQPPAPEGTGPAGSPRQISRRVTPPLRGLEGGIQAHSKENVKPTIALIGLRSAATVILRMKPMDWLNLRLANDGCFSFNLRRMSFVSYYR